MNNKNMHNPDTLRQAALKAETHFFELEFPIEDFNKIATILNLSLERNQDLMNKSISYWKSLIYFTKNNEYVNTVIVSPELKMWCEYKSN